MKRLGLAVVILALIGGVGGAAQSVAATKRPPRVGDRCLAKYNKQYKAWKLVCVKGHLKRIAAKKPVVPPPPPPPPAPLVGSRANPIPLASTKNAGEYGVAVAGVVSDATAMVLAENQFNDPPAAGRQFFIVTLSYKYVGTSKGTPWLDLSGLRVSGSRNVLYDSFSSDSRCGVIPNDIDSHGDLLTGGADTANMCFSVPSDEVTSLEMTNRDATVWWALH